MFWFLMVVAYVLIGGFTARRIFVRHIDKHGRDSIVHRDDRGRVVAHSDPFAAPFWGGVFWPFVLLDLGLWSLWSLIEVPTPKERRERKRQELEDKAAEIRAIGEHYNLPVDGYIQDGDVSVKIGKKRLSAHE